MNFAFYNRRPITKSMLAWWAFTNEQQAYLSSEQPFEIEHIYARNRQDVEKIIVDNGKVIPPSVVKYVPTKLVLEYIGLDEDYIFKMASRIS